MTEHASLREDYLNQVQRDFLSLLRRLTRRFSTPSECVVKRGVDSNRMTPVIAGNQLKPYTAALF
jgi:hypothetical protein